MTDAVSVHPSFGQFLTRYEHDRIQTMQSLVGAGLMDDTFLKERNRLTGMVQVLLPV
jgi:hypothetical protein